MANGIFDLQVKGCTAPKVTLDYISGKDGTQNTLLLSERASYIPTGSAYLPNGGGWTTTKTAEELIGSQGVTHFDDAEEELGFTVPTGIGTDTFIFINEEDPANLDRKGVLFAGHPGVVVVSFCDGHQDTISKDIDRNVFMHLMTPDGKKALITATAQNWNDFKDITGVLNSDDF